MAIQLEFDFWSAEAPEMKAAADSDRLQSCRFEVIAKMIADRRVPVWTISRKIAGEMADMIKQAKAPVRPFQRRRPQVDPNSQMKALRELQKTLVETEGLSKKDLRDLDGPKFKFVFGEIIRLFQQALKDAGTDRFQAVSVMIRFDSFAEG